MVAYFLADQISRNKLKFENVPVAFRAKVKEILVDGGFGELAETESN